MASLSTRSNSTLFFIHISVGPKCTNDHVFYISVKAVSIQCTFSLVSVGFSCGSGVVTIFRSVEGFDEDVNSDLVFMRLLYHGEKIEETKKRKLTIRLPR